jgi:hypothetical protein
MEKEHMLGYVDATGRVWQAVSNRATGSNAAVHEDDILRAATEILIERHRRTESKLLDLDEELRRIAT